MPELEWARVVATELHTKLVATRAERDKVCNDVEGAVLAKEAARAQLQKLNAEACIHRLSDQASDVSWLSSELGATKTEVATLRDQVVGFDAKEVKLSSKLKLLQAKNTWLRTVLEVPPMRTSLKAKGDVSGQVSGPSSSEHRAAIILEYLHGDAHWRREEIERSYYTHHGFVRALSEVAALYSELDLSSLVRELGADLDG
ncbi:hypothetical protein ACLOJK_026495 [Asimina triloba]